MKCKCLPLKNLRGSGAVRCHSQSGRAHQLAFPDLFRASILERERAMVDIWLFSI